MTIGRAAKIRRGYALGSVATGAFGTVPGLLLLPYLTDHLGISAVLAAVIVFAPKAWDVVLNPIAGRISDRSADPRGRRRPFLLKGGLLLAIFFAFLFAGPREPPFVAGLYVSVMFIACATAYAFFQVPYVAMPAEITDDYYERTRMMVWRVAVLALAILASGAIAPAIVHAFDDGSEATGYRVMGIFVATLIAGGVIAVWRGTRDAPEHAAGPASGSLREQLRLVASARDFRLLLAAFVMQALAVGAMLAGVAYAAKHLLHSSGAATWLFLAFVGPALLVTPLWERLFAQRGKRAGYMAASNIMIIGAFGLLSVREPVIGVVYVCAALIGVGYAGAQVFPMSMLPDVAAHDAKVTGQNRIGVYTGVWTAGETLGLAMGPGLFALILASGGYISSATGTVDQPESALNAISIGFSVVPALLITLSLLCLRRYALDKEFVGER